LVLVVAVVALIIKLVVAARTYIVSPEDYDLGTVMITVSYSTLQ
jgi:hypothetical protein